MSRKYERRPKHDRHVARGDGFSGDAWLNTETGKIEWGAVGHNRNRLEADEQERGLAQYERDMMRDECEHGSLRRSCETCEWQQRAEKAEAELARVSNAGVLTVLAELDRARAKFPRWPTDPLHALAVLGEEYGELTRAVLQRCYDYEDRTGGVETEAVQVAAMALRFLGSLHEYEYEAGLQHRDDEQEAGNDE